MTTCDCRTTVNRSNINALNSLSSILYSELAVNIQHIVLTQLAAKTYILVNTLFVPSKLSYESSHILLNISQQHLYETH